MCGWFYHHMRNQWNCKWNLSRSRKFFQIRGLEISAEKTKIIHIEEGFDFLGWNFKKTNGTKGHPSAKSIRKVKESIKEVFTKSRAVSQDQLMRRLNPVIIDWSNYHKHAVSAETFYDIDHYVWELTWTWSKRRHTRKSRGWIYKRYWKSDRHSK